MSFVLPVLCHMMPLLHPILFFRTTFVFKILWVLDCYLILWAFPCITEIWIWRKKCRHISVPYLFISGLLWCHLKSSMYIAVKEVKANCADICELNSNEKNTSSIGKRGTNFLCTNRIISNIEDHFSVTNVTAGKLCQFSLVMKSSLFLL